MANHPSTCRDAPSARIRRRHKELVCILYIAKRCPYNLIRFYPLTCRDAPLARIRRIHRNLDCKLSVHM